MSVHDRVERADKEQIQVRAAAHESTNLIHLFSYSVIPSFSVLLFWLVCFDSSSDDRRCGSASRFFSIIFVVTELREMVERTDQQVEDEPRNSVIYECCDKEATNDHVVLRVVYSRWFSRLLFSDICSYSRNGLSRNSGNSCIHTHTHRERDVSGRWPSSAPIIANVLTMIHNPVFSVFLHHQKQKRNPNRSKKESLPPHHHAKRVFCVFVYIKCDWMFCLHRKLYKPWPQQQLPTKWITF